MHTFSVPIPLDEDDQAYLLLSVELPEKILKMRDKIPDEQIVTGDAKHWHIKKSPSPHVTLLGCIRLAEVEGAESLVDKRSLLFQTLMPQLKTAFQDSTFRVDGVEQWEPPASYLQEDLPSYRCIVLHLEPDAETKKSIQDLRKKLPNTNDWPLNMHVTFTYAAEAYADSIADTLKASLGEEDLVLTPTGAKLSVRSIPESNVYIPF